MHINNLPFTPEAETIDLSNQQIDSFPLIFSTFKNMKVLNLQNTNLNSIGTFDLAELCNLTILNLSHNKLYDLCFLDCFFSYRPTKLSKIDCSHNQITEIQRLPKTVTELKLNNNLIVSYWVSFTGLKHLKILDLSNNYIDSLDNANVEDLENIETFHIENNPLESLPEALQNHKSLNLFTDTPLPFIKKPTQTFYLINPKTECLDFSNRMLNIVPSNVYVFKNVTVINLQNNQLKSLDRKGMEGLNNLKTLNISHNLFRELEFLRSFDEYSSTLSKLDCSYNKIIVLPRLPRNITEVNLKNNLIVDKFVNFHGLNNLKFLDLSDNRINTLNNAEMDHLESLETLNIENNPLESLPESLNHLTSLRIFNNKPFIKE